MKTNKITITINRELFAGLFILLPYIETGFIATKMAVFFSDGYVKAIVVIMLFISFVLLFCGATRRHFLFVRNKLFRAECLMAVYLLVRVLFQWPLKAQYFSTMLWIVVPMFYSLILANSCFSFHLHVDELLRSVFFWFATYEIFVVIYNIVFLGLYRDSSVRMTASAGGAVIFGYTIAFMYSLLVANGSIFSKKQYYFYTILFFVCAISTGSRGSLWPMLAIAAFDWLKIKFTVRKVILVVFAFIAVIIIDPIEKISVMFPHLFTTANTYREFTIENSFKIFAEADFFTKVFGYGIGYVFPYQKWLISVSENVIKSYENVVPILGRNMLVQPHNTYIYLTLESGLLWVALLINYIVSFFRDIVKNKMVTLTLLALPCLTFLFVNFFDSVLCVAPGVAASLWTLLLLHHNTAYGGASCEIL